MSKKRHLKIATGDEATGFTEAFDVFRGQLESLTKVMNDSADRIEKARVVVRTAVLDHVKRIHHDPLEEHFILGVKIPDEVVEDIEREILDFFTVAGAQISEELDRARKLILHHAIDLLAGSDPLGRVLSRKFESNLDRGNPFADSEAAHHAARFIVDDLMLSDAFLVKYKED